MNLMLSEPAWADSTGLADGVRIVVMFVGFTLAMMCGKFAWLGYRGGESFRAWGLASYALLVITPSLTALFRFGTPLLWIPTITYALALICGVVSLRTVYTVNPEWIRLRTAARNHQLDEIRDARRAGEDALRAGDRVAQAEERADSREAYDDANPRETALGTQVEAREEQDANRVHSHGLQDDERDVARAEEDRPHRG